MIYLLSFIEGIITFVSPCILPLLPVYIAYFIGGNQEKSNRKLLINTTSFVIGFTTVFVLMGTLAGFLGGLLIKYQGAIQLVTGLFVLLCGLYFLEFFPTHWFQRKGRSQGFQMNQLAQNPLSFFLFGLVFALAWSPCLGAFLGSALSLASQRGTVFEGGLMLFVYSLGLGLPFIISGFLLESLKGLFTKIKKNYALINKVSGILLVILGLLMMTGLLNRLQLWLL